MTNPLLATASAPPDCPTRCRPTRWAALLLSCLCLLLLTLSGQAKGPIGAAPIRYVKPGGVGDGTTWANASGDLQAMINATSAGGQVWVAQGTYRPTTTTDRTKSFAMKEGVAIYGGFAGTETTLSQRPQFDPESSSISILSGNIGQDSYDDNSYHVIANGPGLTAAAVLDGFLVTNGNAGESGVLGGNVSGGGVYNDGSGANHACSPGFRNCAFWANSAFSGGGAMYNDGSGGGTSSPQLTNCAFSANSTSYYGGAVYNDGYNGTSSPQLTNCTFLSNSADSGGAMVNYGESGNSSPKLINCAFVTNQASSYGGAMYNHAVNGTSSPQLINCTFTYNTASNGGGAMYNDGESGSCSPQFINCVLWFNEGANTFYSLSNVNITATYSLFDNTVTGYNTTGTGNLTTTTNPFTFEGSLVLAVGSKAIDAGNVAAYNTASGPTTDLVGNPRIFPTGGNIDMGAVELQTAPVQPIRYVKANGTGDGSSWASASSDLQAMINATGVTQVWIAGGTYKPKTTGLADPREASFVMKNGVAIYGGFAGTETNLSERPAVNPTAGTPSSTTLSGDIGQPNLTSDNSYHVIVNNSNSLNNTAVLDGVVITGGNASIDGSLNGHGGGILNNYTGNPTFVNCALINNSAVLNGGGVWNGNGTTPILTNCSLQSNSATQDGGGVYNLSSTPTLTNCSLHTNSATKGGGIANVASSPTLTNCRLIGNIATGGGGGGIYNTGTSKPVLVNCSLQTNSAAKGGGIYCAQTSSITLVNCSLLGNTATAAGGGFYIKESSNATLANCALWNNGAGNTLYQSQSTFTATYSLFDNTVTGYNTDGVGNKTTSTSPFASAGVVLAPNSPAINAGSNQAYNAANGGMPPSYNTDLAGNPRIFPTGGTIDMGAIESQTIPVLTLTPSATPTEVCVGSPASLSVEVSSGTAPYSYTWVAPVGVTLSATNTRMISATPTATGVQTLTVLVSDNSSPALSASATVPLTANASPDYQPLVNLYNATNGSNWTGKEGWLSSCDPCKGSNGRAWQGVVCDGGRVSILYLSNKQLAGSLPTSLSALTNLVDLYVDGNQLSGIIPASLSALTSLRNLTLDNNQLSGSIPASFSSLTSLEGLRVANNQLTGSIPAGLGTLPKLYTLRLNNNQLSGSIPASLGSLKLGEGTLDLSNNQLSGCLPTALKALCNMGSYINISGNPGLPGGGDWNAFCSGATNGNCVITLQTTATPNPILAGNAATLGVVASGATAPYSYTWAAPPGITLTTANQPQTSAQIPAGTSGVLTFTITVADATPITSTSLVQLTVSAASPLTQTVCRNSQVILNSGLSGVRYEWYKGGRTAAHRLINVQSVQIGTTTASLTLVSMQTRATFYCKATTASGTAEWAGPFAIEVNGGCSGRVGATEPEAGLQVVVAPNPLENGWLRASIRGVAGQPLQVQLLNLSGTSVRAQQWPAAEAEQAVEWNLSERPAGLYLLKVRTPEQSQTLRIIKP